MITTVTRPSDQLLEVVTALLVEQGFEGVSVRKVATRAGVSIGAVQHHFPTKDAMLAAAMESASARFRERVADRLPTDGTPDQLLRELLLELVGARPDQRDASVLWVARLARAAVDPVTAATHAREWDELAQTVTGLVHAARPDRDRAWADDRAAGLLALVDGLAVTALREPERMPPARAERLLTDQLDRVLAETSGLAESGLQ